MLKTTEGFKFRFQHYVPLAVELEENGNVRQLEREGTAVEVELPDHLTLAAPYESAIDSVTGFAVVHPNDQYDRAEGRRHALANALQPLPRELRADVWRAYWNLRGRVGNA